MCSDIGREAAHRDSTETRTECSDSVQCSEGRIKGRPRDGNMLNAVRYEMLSDFSKNCIKPSETNNGLMFA